MDTDDLRRRLKPVALVTLVAVAFAAIGLLAYVNLRKEITLQDENKKIVITTFASTVGDLLKERGIELRQEDVVKPSLNTRLKNGMTITIKRAVPVTLNVGGKVENIYSAASTIKDLLSERGIALGPQDKINMTLDTPVFAYMYIDITKVTEKIITEEIDIPYQIETVKDYTMERGQTRIAQQGEMGKKVKVIKVTYENGKEVARNVIEEKVIKNPVPQIVRVGTLGVFTTSRREIVRYREVKTMLATAYDSSEESTGKKPGDPDYGITASGMVARRGVVAVDPRVIPLGTRLYVEGYGFCIAADTGGAIKGNRIDVYFPTREEVRNWGRRYVKVYILQ
ncbi:ubiquitin-like domain-containing protein [Caldanaerobacter subterraneus]|uniref:ubiquitin-like domain-containing protein n=1 Tax=Caldanaerobacter subterraneus TaxID=911092 RepID=UPI0034641AE6